MSPAPERAAQSARLRVLPARQRGGAVLRRAHPGARAVPARAGSGSAVRAGLGASRPLLPGHRQVRRRHARQRNAGRDGVPARPGHRAATVGRAQVLRRARSRHGPRRAGGRAAPAGSDAPRQRPGAVRRARPHAAGTAGCTTSRWPRMPRRRRLDPNVSTSVEQTVLMTDDLERLLAVEPAPAGGGDEGIRVMGLGLGGRRDEARRALDRDASDHPAAGVSGVDRLPDGLARSAAGRHARQDRGPQRVEDPAGPRGDLPGGMAALRCRRARERPRATCSAPSRRATTPRPPSSRSRHFDALRSHPGVPCACWPRPKPAGSVRWRRFARPVANGCSGGRPPEGRAVKTLARPRDRDELVAAAATRSSRQRRQMGTHVGASDDLSHRGRLPDGDWRQGSQ